MHSRFGSPVRKVCFTALLALLPLCAQETASSVSGKVQDPRGAPIPNARVAIINIHTSALRSTETAADGSYTFTNLPAGPYELQAAKDGFGTVNHNNIVLQANASQQVNVTVEGGL